MLQRMRKSRGLTQVQLAESAGVSLTTIKKLEGMSSELQVRDRNLDAILTAMARKASLGPSEIQQLADATDRLYDSFEALNTRADQLNMEAMLGPMPTKRRDLSVEERIAMGVHTLIAAGQSRILLAQIESLVRVFEDEIEHQAKSERSVRQLRVRHPERRVGDMVIEDISHYEVDDDDQPRERRPVSDPDNRPPNSVDSDSIDGTA